MPTAKDIINQAGLKSTASRLDVVSVLSEHSDLLTHQDILGQLPDNFDRVTLYRVLDWLLQNNVAHRVAGEDRVWHFQLNNSHKRKFNKATVSSATSFINQHSHAHFQCGDCGKVFCLEGVYPKLSNAVPAGFNVDLIELNIKGKCVKCQK
jgi:Fur family ferric uptake transcriptional regulator|tara:strand:+ start:17580 stop:18032 length:453 start_codon:yes stop_codon:yes gene_type:complete